MLREPTEVEHPPNSAIDACLIEAAKRFQLANPNSLAQHERATHFMPGGNTRTVLFNAPFPITLVNGHGAHVRSADQTEYLDFLGEYTAGLYGHSNAVIAEAVRQALQNGLVLGGHTVSEAEFAQLLCERFEALQLVRFTNSGTEANLMAINAALEFTGRQAVLAFEGGYHGSGLNFSGARARNAPYEFILAPYNDCDFVRSVFTKRGNHIAAVIVEPMLGSGGCIPGSREFLQLLREATSRCGALLILDEVMTSRLSPGGLQAIHQIVPDIVTLGKYLGGGFSFGAFGGRADVMGLFDPRRPNAFQHAGTFNNNVCSMAAGLAGLRDIFTPAVNITFNGRGDALRQRLSSLLRKSGLPIAVTGIGSMMHIHMCRGPISTHADGRTVNPKLRDLFFYDLLANGIWSAHRGMFSLSLPMTEQDHQRLVNAVDDFIAERSELFGD